MPGYMKKTFSEKNEESPLGPLLSTRIFAGYCDYHLFTFLDNNLNVKRFHKITVQELFKKKTHFHRQLDNSIKSSLKDQLTNCDTKLRLKPC